ncbi:MAG: FtsX-like permease family protein [Planctomycetota bacterium]
MYKLLLCWRYLRTRYIALASIISVMLGVATLIVVNAVMAGSHAEYLKQLHGIHSDLELHVRSMEGAPDAQAHMARIREAAGDKIAGVSPTVQVPAMLGYYIGQQYITRQVMVVGVDEATYASVSNFGGFLKHPDNRERLDFQLKEGGYDSGRLPAEADAAADAAAEPAWPQMKNAGWAYRRMRHPPPVAAAAAPTPEPAPASTSGPTAGPADPFAGLNAVPLPEHDPATMHHVGCVLGIGLVSGRGQDGAKLLYQLPGDDVELTFPSAGRPPKPLSAKFTAVDFYESKVGDYDAACVFVPLADLQRMRGMVDPATGVANFTALQIRLAEGADLSEVRSAVQGLFAERYYYVSTWIDKQGPMLAAIQVETAVLNILLFLIIAVAGFGILAIFYMIVVEKTRDIGILKSLGASSGGVMSIFLTYGLLLGVVGSTVGVIGGLVFVRYLNEIADGIGAAFGMNLFDPDVYPFPKIPTIVDPVTVSWITAGAMLIAVLASVMPARRAAAMHPVAALRWE